MKGVIFTEFLEMVEEQFSPAMADELLDSVETASGGVYTAVGTYQASEMVALVSELSARSGTPVPDLLRAYGTYLFGHFVKAYPELFAASSSAVQLLESVDGVIHVEVVKLYPDAELPRFESRRLDDGTFELDYRSPRNLHDVALGLIEGAVDHFGTPMSIDMAPLPAPDTGMRFTLVAP